MDTEPVDKTPPGYLATPEELDAIDEDLQGDAANDEEVEAAFAAFRRA
jgi:hypothetical protein